ncbi:unnamed protein product [Closterium sp. Yama58-4]|nr:unnamed protein product [Closterium sp. Yama58-4]
MVYIKHIVTSLGLNTWGFVLYNNFLSLLMAPVFWMITGEFRETIKAVSTASWDFGIVFPVLLSCAFGLAISFFGFACRKAISATAFTVLGVTNKLLTVVINVMIWDKHASPFGVLCLFITIVGGVMYQQSTVKQNYRGGGGGGSAKREELKPLTSPKDVEAHKDHVEEEGAETAAEPQ